jgi:hypothetical protein
MDFVDDSDATPEERFQVRQRHNCGFESSLKQVRGTADETPHSELSIRLNPAEARRLQEHEYLGPVARQIAAQEAREAPDVFAGTWRSELSEAPSIVVGLVGLDPTRIDAVRHVAGDAPVRFESAVVSADTLAAAQHQMTEDFAHWREAGVLIHSSSVDIKHNRLTVGVAEKLNPATEQALASRYAPVPILIVKTEGPTVGGRS